MKRVTAQDALRLRQLEQRLGSRLVRTVMTDPQRRLMRPERLENLKSGRGRLSADEHRLLQRLSVNAQSVEQLSKKKTTDEKKGRKRKDWKVNRSIRDWVHEGKERDADRPTDTEGKEDEQRAIRGLRFLGVDPSEKHYYLRKVKAA